MNMSNKNKIDNVSIYSIESRKGGVGKTTIALNLANVLRNKGSLVLVLDFDFLGTSMAEAIRCSQYWSKQEINVVKEKKNKEGEEYEDVNLVDLLNPSKHQMLKSLIKVASNAKKLPITIISSKFPSKDTDDIYLLLDELHVFGYVNLLNTLIHEFISLNPGESSYSIIIDHSPGNSSLHKEMNEWIIKNYSVDNAKFVLVSSLDPQDFSACIETAGEIKGFVDKIVRFSSTIEETLPQSFEDIDRSLYYDILDEQVCLPQKETKASAYLALILNKVPTEVLHSELFLDYGFGDDSMNQLFNEIALYSTKMQYPKNMILYDNTIGLQYMSKRIQPVFRGDVLNVIKDGFLEVVQEINNVSDIDVPILKGMADKYTKICDMLVKNHYTRYANVLLKNEKLSPAFPLMMIESTVRNLVSLTFTMGKSGLVKNIKNEDKYKQSIVQLEKFIADLRIPDLSVSLVSVWQYLFSVANYKHRGTEPLVSALALMLHLFIQVQQNRYGTSKKYRDFLAKEYLIDFNNQEWNTCLESIISGIINCNEIDKLCKAVIPQFNEFYRKLCYFILRLIDLNFDLQFIFINTLQAIQQGNSIPPHNLSRYFEIAVVEKQNAIITEIKLRKELMKSEMFAIESILKNNILESFTIK